MTELTIPPTAEPTERAAMIRDFLEVGDEVVLGDGEQTDPSLETTGEVTALEPKHLELNPGPGGHQRISYASVESVVRLDDE